MSAGEEYVIRRLVRDDAEPGALNKVFDSERAAHVACSDWNEQWPQWTHTVHKLGPALEPPEPRDRVVVSDEGWAAGMGQLQTRKEANRILERSRDDFTDLRIVRVVPEGVAE